MNKEIKRLRIALIAAVALLSTNAVTAVLGWSPLESVVQEQISKQSNIAEAMSTEKRNQLNGTDATVKTLETQYDHRNAHQLKYTDAGQKRTQENPNPVTVRQDVKETYMVAPVAPIKPLAPEISLRPAAPTPPSYIFYYPDDSRHYVYQLVDQQTAPYSE